MPRQRSLTPLAICPNGAIKMKVYVLVCNKKSLEPIAKTAKVLSTKVYFFLDKMITNSIYMIDLLAFFATFSMLLAQKHLMRGNINLDLKILLSNEYNDIIYI